MQILLLRSCSLLFFEDFGKQAPRGFRNNEVRAGGDEINNTFIATGYQVEMLQDNPYLETYAKPAPNKDEYYVYYLYPSLPRAYKKLVDAGIITQAQIKVFQNQTSAFMGALLKILFLDYYRESATSSRGDKIAVDYVSIHPYDDLNGRTSRFLSHIAHFGVSSSYFMRYNLCSDMDLVTGFPLYRTFVEKSSQLYTALIKSMFVEMLRKLRLFEKAEKYDYYNLPEFNGIVKALSVFNINVNSFTRFTQPQLDIIRVRNWVKLFDSLHGSISWRQSPSASFDWRKQ